MIDLTKIQMFQWTLDWSIKIIIEQFQRGFLKIDNFNDKDCWNLYHQSKYIESIILDIPLDHIVLFEVKKGGPYQIINGKNRLNSIRKFSEISINDEFVFESEDLLILKNLRVLSELNNLSYKEFSTDLKFYDLCNNYINRNIRIIIIKNCNSKEWLDGCYERLNYFHS